MRLLSQDYMGKEKVPGAAETPQWYKRIYRHLFHRSTDRRHDQILRFYKLANTIFISWHPGSHNRRTSFAYRCLWSPVRTPSLDPASTLSTCHLYGGAFGPFGEPPGIFQGQTLRPLKASLNRRLPGIRLITVVLVHMYRSHTNLARSPTHTRPRLGIDKHSLPGQRLPTTRSIPNSRKSKSIFSPDDSHQRLSGPNLAQSTTLRPDA